MKENPFIDFSRTVFAEFGTRQPVHTNPQAICFAHVPMKDATQNTTAIIDIVYPGHFPFYYLVQWNIGNSKKGGIAAQNAPATRGDPWPKVNDLKILANSSSAKPLLLRQYSADRLMPSGIVYWAPMTKSVIKRRLSGMKSIRVPLPDKTGANRSRPLRTAVSA